MWPGYCPLPEVRPPTTPGRFHVFQMASRGSCRMLVTSWEGCACGSCELFCQQPLRGSSSSKIPGLPVCCKAMLVCRLPLFPVLQYHPPVLNLLSTQSHASPRSLNPESQDLELLLADIQEMRLGEGQQAESQILVLSWNRSRVKVGDPNCMSTGAPLISLAPSPHGLMACHIWK